MGVIPFAPWAGAQAVETAQLEALDPPIADLDVGALDGRPGNAVGRLILARVARVRCKCVIESRSENVLGMLGQVLADRGRKCGVRCIRHNCSSVRGAC